MIGVLSLALLAAGEPDPNLAQAMLLFQRLEYQRCLDKLARVPESAPAANRALAELYRGLCGFPLHKSDVRAHFVRALELDASTRLPPLASPKIQALFDEVLAAQPKPAPAVAAPSADAPTATKLEPPPTPPPAVEVVPAQSRVPAGLPVALLSAAAVAAAAGVGFGLAQSQTGRQLAGI